MTTRLKKQRIVLAACLLFIYSSTTVFASSTWGVQKLGRGFLHILTSPFFLPKEVIQTAAEAEPSYAAPWKGMTAGLGKGLFQMGCQLVSGFGDIFTFYIPSEPLFKSDSLFPEV